MRVLLALAGCTFRWRRSYCLPIILLPTAIILFIKTVTWAWSAENFSTSRVSSTDTLSTLSRTARGDWGGVFDSSMTGSAAATKPFDGLLCDRVRSTNAATLSFRYCLSASGIDRTADVSVGEGFDPRRHKPLAGCRAWGLMSMPVRPIAMRDSICTSVFRAWTLGEPDEFTSKMD